MWKHSWKVLFGCLVWDLMPFFVKIVLWKGSKSHFISLLIYECVSVTVVLHQTWCLPLLWHLVSTFPLLSGHQMWCLACSAWPSNCSHQLQKCFIFFCLMIGYTHSTLWYLQSHTFSVFTLSSRLSLIFCPEGICLGKTSSL